MVMLQQKNFNNNKKMERNRKMIKLYKFVPLLLCRHAEGHNKKRHFLFLFFLIGSVPRLRGIRVVCFCQMHSTNWSKIRCSRHAFDLVKPDTHSCGVQSLIPLACSVYIRLYYQSFFTPGRDWFVFYRSVSLQVGMQHNVTGPAARSSF